MMTEDKLKISQYSLFSPKSKASLLNDYPELKTNRDLKDLKPSEILFCYYLGCKTSPLYQLYSGDEGKREKRGAVNEAKKLSNFKVHSDMDQQVFFDLEFPSNIKLGIKAFSNYEPNARIRFRLIKEKILNNLEKIIDIDADDASFNVIDKEGQPTTEKDYDKLKKYVDICSSVQKVSPELLRDLEYGEGLTDNGSSSAIDDDDISFIDKLHETT